MLAIASNFCVAEELPVQTDQKQHQTSSKQSNTDPVEALELLHLRLTTNVELLISWWVVEEVIQADSEEVDNASEDVRPSPLECGVFVEGARNWWAKYSKRNRGREDECVERTTLSIGYQLTNCDVKRQLSSCCKPVERVRANKHVD